MHLHPSFRTYFEALLREYCLAVLLVDAAEARWRAGRTTATAAALWRALAALDGVDGRIMRCYLLACVGAPSRRRATLRLALAHLRATLKTMHEATRALMAAPANPEAKALAARGERTLRALGRTVSTIALAPRPLPKPIRV